MARGIEAIYSFIRYSRFVILFSLQHPFIGIFLVFLFFCDLVIICFIFYYVLGVCPP